MGDGEHGAEVVHNRGGDAREIEKVKKEPGCYTGLLRDLIDP